MKEIFDFVLDNVEGAREKAEKGELRFGNFIWVGSVLSREQKIGHWKKNKVKVIEIDQEE